MGQSSIAKRIRRKMREATRALKPKITASALVKEPELVIIDVVKTASMGCDARRARRRYNQRPHFVH